MLFRVAFSLFCCVVFSQECVYESSFGRYDFTPLAKFGTLGPVPDSSSQFITYLSICHDASEIRGLKSGMALQCETADSCSFVLGRWTSPNWQLIDPSDERGGVRMSFNNGDPCLKADETQPVKSEVHFVCDPDAPGTEYTAKSDNFGCDWLFTVPSVYACEPRRVSWIFDGSLNTCVGVCRREHMTCTTDVVLPATEQEYEIFLDQVIQVDTTLQCDLLSDNPYYYRASPQWGIRLDRPTCFYGNTVMDCTQQPYSTVGARICPCIAGCLDHSDCGEDEYCDATGTCKSPCSFCNFYQDSVDGSCPCPDDGGKIAWFALGSCCCGSTCHDVCRNNDAECTENVALPTTVEGFEILQAAVRLEDGVPLQCDNTVFSDLASIPAFIRTGSPPITECQYGNAEMNCGASAFCSQRICPCTVDCFEHSDCGINEYCDEITKCKAPCSDCHFFEDSVDGSCPCPDDGTFNLVGDGSCRDVRGAFDILTADIGNPPYYLGTCRSFCLRERPHCVAFRHAPDGCILFQGGPYTRTGDEDTCFDCRCFAFTGSQPGSAAVSSNLWLIVVSLIATKFLVN